MSEHDHVWMYVEHIGPHGSGAWSEACVCGDTRNMRFAHQSEADGNSESVSSKPNPGPLAIRVG